MLAKCPPCWVQYVSARAKFLAGLLTYVYSDCPKADQLVQVNPQPPCQLPSTPHVNVLFPTALNPATHTSWQLDPTALPLLHDASVCDTFRLLLIPPDACNGTH